MKHIFAILGFYAIISYAFVSALNVIPFPSVMFQVGSGLQNGYKLRLRGMLYRKQYDFSGKVGKMLSSIGIFASGIDKETALSRLSLIFSSGPPKDWAQTLKISVIKPKSWNDFKDYGNTADVQESVAGEKVTQVKPDHVGYFDALVNFSKDDVEEFITSDTHNVQVVWIQIAYEVDNALKAVHVPVTVMKSSDGIQVISDIDDTVLELGGTEGVKELVKNSFFRPYIMVKDMNKVYQKIAASMRKQGRSISFHYFSGVTWQLVPAYIKEFFLKNGFPWMSFLAKHKLSGNLVSSPWDTVKAMMKLKPSKEDEKLMNEVVDIKDASGTFKYKYANIDELISLAPHLWNNLVLVGDSTKADALVYYELAKKYKWSSVGGKVQCIIIRFVESKRNLKKSNSQLSSKSRRSSGYSSSSCSNDDDSCSSASTSSSKSRHKMPMPLSYEETIDRMKDIFGDLENWEKHIVVFRDGRDLKNLDFIDNTCATN